VIYSLKTRASTQRFGDVSSVHQTFFFSAINVVFTLCNFVFNLPNKSIACTTKFPPYCSTIFLVFTQPIPFFIAQRFHTFSALMGCKLELFPLFSHIFVSFPQKNRVIPLANLVVSYQPSFRVFFPQKNRVIPQQIWVSRTNNIFILFLRKIVYPPNELLGMILCISYPPLPSDFSGGYLS
jgi:hypothetical protein